MEASQKDLFENSSVIKAVVRLAVPSIMGQIILVIYNMADTYFVGLTGNDAMITAVTVCLPSFMFLSAISNLFGIGGGSAYARALGRQKTGRCSNIASHAMYGCLFVTMLYALAALLFRNSFISILGGSDPAVHTIAVRYMVITVCAGGAATAMGTMFSHLIRAEGRSDLASRGIILGGILNIIFDPLFMFVLLPAGNEVTGAAIATALSNTAACTYFVVLLKTKSTLKFRYNEDAFTDGSMREIIMTGLPACLMTLFENISYAVLDALMAAYGISAQAGIGVAKKVNMLAHSIVRGLTQGVLPLIAYSYAARNYRRLREAFRITVFSAVTVSAVLTLTYCIFSHQLIHIFITGGQSMEFGIVFLRILCFGCPFSAFAYTAISFFQAVSKARRSFCLAALRKGAVDIPLMFLFGKLKGMYGIAAATPTADIVCSVVSAFFIHYWFKTHKTTSWEEVKYA